MTTRLERILRLKKVAVGVDHPETLSIMDRLAGEYQSANEVDNAVRLYKEAYELRKAKLGLTTLRR